MSRGVVQQRLPPGLQLAVYFTLARVSVAILFFSIPLDRHKTQPSEKLGHECGLDFAVSPGP